jgi:hypothetical protein
MTGNSRQIQVDAIDRSSVAGSQRIAPSPAGTAAPGLDDKVHKVGRTSGLTFGEVKQVGVIVGPVAYGIGGCWFRQSFVIEGVHGTTFSDPEDSGAAVVRDDGKVWACYARELTCRLMPDPSLLC